MINLTLTREVNTPIQDVEDEEKRGESSYSSHWSFGVLTGEAKRPVEDIEEKVERRE